MPRDLTSLVKEQAIPDNSDAGEAVQKPATNTDQDKPQGTMFAAQAEMDAKRDDVHPYTQTLTLNDVESCVILEEAAFPPQERATREKVSQSPCLAPPNKQRCTRPPVTFRCHSAHLHALAIPLSAVPLSLKWDHACFGRLHVTAFPDLTLQAPTAHALSHAHTPCLRTHRLSPRLVQRHVSARACTHTILRISKITPPETNNPPSSSTV